MKSKTLNKKIRELFEEGKDYTVRGLEDAGKNIPYIGWYWRDVDFDTPSMVMNKPDGVSGWDKPEFSGFMENNKWGYDSYRPTKNQMLEIKRLIEMAVKSPSDESLQAVFDYIQEIANDTTNYLDKKEV